MTYPVNYSKQQPPAYSGVTINITSPTVNAAPQVPPMHQCNCEHCLNQNNANYMTNPQGQYNNGQYNPNVYSQNYQVQSQLQNGYYLNTNAQTQQNAYYAQDTMSQQSSYNSSIQDSNTSSRVVEQQSYSDQNKTMNQVSDRNNSNSVSSNSSDSSSAQYHQNSNTSSNTEQNTQTNTITEKVIEKTIIDKTAQVESNNSSNLQTSKSDIASNSSESAQNQSMQTIPQGQQAYPAQYYLNNYNYNIQDGKPVSKVDTNTPNFQPENSNGLAQGAYSNSNQNGQFPVDENQYYPQGLNTNGSYEEDLSTSKEIITELDARVAEQKELEKTGKKTRVIALTNEYIMSLENYLNNPNTEIRLMAAKEILTRLNEDRERYDDAALNALLNKMLQDPNKLVRIAALSAFASELASGNDYTVQLLNNIKNNPNADKDDVLQVANILLNFHDKFNI